MGILHVFSKNENQHHREVEVKILFDELYDSLVYFSRQITQDDMQAEDIVQDAFVRLWDGIHLLDPSRRVQKSYLYNVVKNMSLNALRHSKVVDGYKQSNEHGEADQMTALEAMMSAEVIAQLHEALEGLPQPYRTISSLSFLEGKKNQEIADELGISVNTIKKQKQKAIQLLRLKLIPILLWIMTMLLPLYLFV